MAKAKLTKEQITRIFEILIEKNAPILTHQKFRGLLDRDQNLATNQIIRQANGNIAYRTVDFDVIDINDEEFWARIEDTPYNDLIEENAAAALVKMAEKLGVV
ncbi:MAG TPA: hypothetical protein PKU96_01305 [bacterium]|jgi:hypothetical protein|nr:hypothetical protein [Myxococcales bacterium]OQA61103.1 MAG: hypothetical protein BWY40_00775 [bacterium ADurb.Bin270]HPW44990.1 hypothetical protein [bacterium]HQG14203.1 hypothetical protein [bacterium]HQH79876.1 hypothetical protein [bacterium]